MEFKITDTGETNGVSWQKVNDSFYVIYRSEFLKPIHTYIVNADKEKISLENARKFGGLQKGVISLYEQWFRFNTDDINDLTLRISNWYNSPPTEEEIKKAIDYKCVWVEFEDEKCNYSTWNYRTFTDEELRKHFIGSEFVLPDNSVDICKNVRIGYIVRGFSIEPKGKIWAIGPREFERLDKAINYCRLQD